MKRALLLLALPFLIATDDAGPPSNWARQAMLQLQTHSHYPAEARELAMEGTVWVEMRVVPDGRILSERVRRSSGYPLLDEAALAAARAASPLPPPGVGAGPETRVVVPVSYRIME